jgi:hypothetical protein
MRCLWVKNYRPEARWRRDHVTSLFHHAVCRTRGPQSFPKPVLPTVLPCAASSLNFQYPLVSSRPSSGCSRLLPRLPFASILPSTFPSTVCFRRQSLLITNRTHTLQFSSTVYTKWKTRATTIQFMRCVHTFFLDVREGNRPLQGRHGGGRHGRQYVVSTAWGLSWVGGLTNRCTWVRCRTLTVDGPWERQLHQGGWYSTLFGIEVRSEMWIKM